ncbi:MAG: AAA family ATPase [Bacteroidaceae bacterium]|nr:AAA family ATPase [Bacteroidaceae bacterium]
MEKCGVFHSYAYQADDGSGYCIIRVRIAPGKYMLCEPRGGVVLPQNLTYGTPLSCDGYIDPKRKYQPPYTYDKCFMCNSMVQTMPNDVASAVDFVEHMGIRGIAAANARHIVDLTGPDMHDYFWRNPDAQDFASKIASLRLPAAEAFIRRIMTTTTQQQMLNRFGAHGATYTDVFQMYQFIVKDMGRECTMDEVITTLKPHMINAQGQIPRGLYYYGAKAGMEFDTIDAIGKSLGYRAYNSERLISLMMKVMSSFSQNGHVWSSLNDVYRMCKTLVSTTAFARTPISKWALYSAAKMSRGLFVVEGNGDRIYLESSWFDERAVVSHLRRIQGTQRVLPFYETIVDEIESERGVTFSAAQRKCFNFLKKSGIHIVTGGAGTGKTTTISGLLSAYTKLNPSAQVALCAPTGRAAQRMTELCGAFGENVRAYTIHKLLDFAPFDGETLPNYNEQNPLSADLLIVDEMSMVDLHLFAVLVQAIKDGASVILCGDVCQLSSVGSGQVFGDLIDSEQFMTVRLTTNYRQMNAGVNNNNIIENANRINEGKWNLKTGSDFEIIACRDDEDMQRIVIDLASKNPDSTVLTTVRDNFAGVDFLNAALQPMMNVIGGNAVTYGKRNQYTLQENDRILMVRNDYEVGYVNGDVGTIVSVDEVGGIITVDLGGVEKEIEATNWSDISLAYAMTIHKSQGSEYDSVIIALPSSATNMWLRNLLYTAITRAKKHVTIVCQPDAIEVAAQNTKTSDRRTTLKELLCA